MLATSDTFLHNVRADARQTVGLVIVDYYKNWNLPFASATATSVASGYSANSACDGRIKPTEYASVGSYIPSALSQPSYGWKGTRVADANGSLAVPELVTIQYKEPVSTRNFWLIANIIDYPVDFDIEILDGTIWRTVVSVNSNGLAEYYHVSENAYTFSSLRIRISKVSQPGGQAYFIEGGAVTTVIYNEDDIVDFSVLEEAKAETETPFGVVSSNASDVTLDNTKGQFLANNANSPYHLLLRPGVRYRPYVGVETSYNVFEYVPLGVYYLAEWASRDSSVTCDISGYDMLYELGTQPVPTHALESNIPLVTLFRNLFMLLGIPTTDFIIDSSIVEFVNYGWYPGATVSEALSELAKAGNCTVYVNRLGKLEVRKVFTDSDPVDTWSFADLVNDFDNPQRFNSVYNGVSVEAHSVSVPKDTQEITRLTNLAIPPNEFYSCVIPFDSVPVIELTKLEINSRSTVVRELNVGATSATVLLYNNRSAADDVELILTGRVLTLSKAVQTVADDDATAKHSKTLTVSSELIQELYNAGSFAKSMLDIVSDPNAIVTMDTRCQPSVELLDSVMFHTQSGPDMAIIPYRIEITYSGGSIASTVEAFRQLRAKRFVPISPGLFINYKGVQ